MTAEEGRAREEQIQADLRLLIDARDTARHRSYWPLVAALTVILLAVNSGAFMAVTFTRQEQLTRIDRELQRTLRREVICSQTHQGAPCRALLLRLRNSAGPREKRMVACDVAHALERSGYRLGRGRC